MNYYNEWDKYAAAWLRNLIAAGHLPAGEVDERSITDVSPDDLAGFTQCHFFAGIGGWSLAARIAGWPEDRELWTGSPPCQPFSAAGKQLGQDDSRHLWPHYFRLIAARRPAVLMGEQVAAAVGKNWLDGVHADLEGIGYSCGAAVVPACAVNAPHRRDRLWFVADASGWTGRQVDPNARGRENGSGAREVPGFGSAGDVAVANASGGRRTGSLDRQGEQSRGAEAVWTGEGDDHVADADHERCSGQHALLRAETTGRNARGLPEASGSGAGGFWHPASWITGHDGKARRVGSEICELVDGLPDFLAGLRADFYAEAIKEVIEHGTQTPTGPAQAMREMFAAVHAQPAADRPMGVSTGVCTPEVLLPFLRELAGRGGAIWCSESFEENAVSELRGVRDLAVSPCSSYRREPAEQRPSQHPDALQALSRILASHAASAWQAYGQAHARPMGLLAHGVPARVGKLRAFGNAIVPQVAAEVIGAYLECRP